MGRGAVSFLLLGLTFAQGPGPGPQVTTFLSTVDDSDQPYGLYLPRNFDASRTYPLVVSLHGAYSNHRLNLRRVFGKNNLPGESDAEASRYFPPLRDVEFIVATPYSRGTLGYQDIGERDVYDVLADVKTRFKIDDDRIYLTGLSMGGGGSLWLALTRPDVWAAVAAVCPAPPPATEEFAGNALNLPVHLFQGQLHPVVPVVSVRQWHRRLLDLDTRVEYVEYPAVRHNAWDQAYKGGAIFDWFSPLRRNRYPVRVRFSSGQYKYNSAYWVRIDGLTPGVVAGIDARFTAPNRISVATSGSLRGFTIAPAGHAMFAAGKPVAVTIDGVVSRVAKGPLSFSRESGAKPWRNRIFAHPPGWKRPGAEGPAIEVISGRHAYIYGTAGSPGEEELQRRRETAELAAEWSRPNRKLLLTHAVLADAEVKDADLSGGSAILFGTRRTNTWIAKLGDSPAIELNPGAADYGLVLVTPAGTRTVLINSGLPFWTGWQRVKRPGLSFLNGPQAVLRSLGDFILFKGSLEDVIAEGRLGANWKVPQDAAARMLATGAVTIR